MSNTEILGFESRESPDAGARRLAWPWRVGLRLEEGVVIVALLVMVVLPLVAMAVNQLNQHVVETPLMGVEGSSSIVQYCTLVVGMIGGAIAARRNRLLALATTSMLPQGAFVRGARIFTGAVGAVVAVFLGVASFEFIKLNDWVYPERVAYGVHKWVFQTVMPVGFAIVAARLIWYSSDRWVGRVIGLILTFGMIACMWTIGEEPPHWFAWLLLGLLILATLLGTPIFATLGGAALILLWKDIVPIGLVGISHHSMVVNPSLPTIPLFTLAGYLLAESKASQRLVRVFKAAFGSLRGGPAVVTILVCTFFTSFTGASGVTILALGALLMPVLLAGRYPEQRALGLVTGSGALGMLFAPCLPLILYSIIASQSDPMRAVSIKQMFLAALVPGIVMVVMTAVLGVYFAPRPQPEEKTPFVAREMWAAIWGAKWELLTPLVALITIFGGFADPVEAAALTALYALITQAIVWRDLRLFRDVPRVMLECGLVIGGVLLILGVAQGFTGYLIDAQMPDKAIEWAAQSVKSPLVFLLLLNLLLLLVGCLMDVYSATIVVVPLLLPIAASYNIDPLHLGVIFLANLELGFLTPPVGMNLFLSSYRFNKPVMQVARSVMPFLLVQLVGVLLITYVPPLTTALPTWLGDHRPPVNDGALTEPPPQ